MTTVLNFDSTKALATGAVAVVLYLFITKLIRYKRLSHIPGPVTTGWSSFWLVWRQASDNIPGNFERAIKKYGPIVRVAPNWLICSDPSEIHRIWSVRSGWRRSTWYHSFRFDPHKDNVLTYPDNEDHRRARAMLIPSYSARGFETQERLMDEQIVRFIDLLERKYVSSSSEEEGGYRPLDMSHVFTFLTQDVMTAIEFSQPMGMIEQDRDFLGVLGLFEKLVKIMVPTATLTWVQTLQRAPVLKPFLPRAGDGSSFGGLLQLIRDHVSERYHPDKDKKVVKDDMLQKMVDSGITQEQAEAEALVALFGGTDSTAMALRQTVFYLASTAPVYRALQAEIDAAIARGEVTRPIISDLEAKKLLFLQACLKEGTRMWPPIGGLLAKVSDKDDVICGMHVPAGTNVAWASKAVVRSREVFGEDADMFNPQRWIDAANDAKANPERLKRMEMTQGLVFGSGTRWECLGKRLAYVELGKVIFELFARYDFAMVNPEEPMKKRHQGLIFHKDMFVKVTKREVQAD
ncbi:cytochrome P450 family protein [Sordaria brevicollis]|uniref:Cytochrome P450 family protein n=1 Tax=Sordaria brevicollis TaxID=83679 RepID=A0AAE0P1F0_SORBR|nr:cytochrome P450 family protein [Sordaria brevicollis]